MRIALSIWVATLLCLSCESPKKQQQRALLRVDETKEAAQRPARKKPSIFDANGNLLPSDQEFDGLKLPRGLTLKRQQGFNRYYTTSVPASKLHFYFGALVITGRVQRVGGAATYVAARPREAKDPSIRFNIKIIPSLKEKGLTRLEIHRILPPKKNPPAQQIIDELNRERRFAQ